MRVEREDVMHLTDERRFVLPYCGARVALNAKYLRSSDLVQISEKKITLKNGKAKKMRAHVKKLPPGWLWRRNRQMGHETGHKSEWMRYPCLYSLWLAGLHIGNQRPIEHEQIAELIEGARQYAVYLVYLHKIRPQDVELFVNEFFATIQGLSTKRAPRKTVAHARFTQSTAVTRGKYLTDSSGRYNPMAAAMQVGAGIGHLQERQQDVIHIGANLDARTVNIFMLIQERMRLYWDLWFAISTGDSYFAGEVLRIAVGGTEPVRILELMERGMMDAAGKNLEHYLSQFSGVCERPFVNNARHVCTDLEALMAETDPEGRARCLEKVRNGIRWIFICHVWWMEFIVPLSMLMHDLIQAQRALRRGTGEKGKVLISKSLAPEEFEHLKKALAKFERRLESCSDDPDKLLEHPLKPRIQKTLSRIHQKIQEDDWRAVKILASRMARIF